LGVALFATRNVERFLAVLAKMPLCKTLIVFPTKLRKGISLVFQDIITRRTHWIAPPSIDEDWRVADSPADLTITDRPR
jgi:hypothetical protein